MTLVVRSITTDGSDLGCLMSNSNIDRLSAERPSVCCFTVTNRAPSFTCNLHQDPSHLAHRRCSDHEKQRPTNNGEPLEVSTGLKSPLRLTPNGVAPSKVLPDPRPHDCQTLNPSSSRRKPGAHVSATGQRVSSDHKFRHGILGHIGL